MLLLLLLFEDSQVRRQHRLWRNQSEERGESGRPQTRPCRGPLLGGLATSCGGRSRLHVASRRPGCDGAVASRLCEGGANKLH